MKEYLKVIDHFLSKESFALMENESSNILKTNPVPDDLAKYYQSDDYLSHNKKQNIISKLYSAVQKLNLNYKLGIIKKCTASISLFDYGCGDGAFLRFMKTNGYQCAGFEPNIDTDVKEVVIAKNLVEVKGQYDIVTLWHVLEHIATPSEALQNIKALMTSNAKLIIAIPNYKSYDAAYYNTYWAAYDVPRHLYHYSKEGALQFFAEQGFKIESVHGLPYDSYFVSMLSEKYKGGLLGKVRWAFIGLWSNIKAKSSGQWSSLIYVMSTQK
jgi:2-polyprenyl-3-methyl-5-hydroxy-6-metoxy-1,4-benzoquinol methylase